MGSSLTKALHLLIWAKTQELCLDIARASTPDLYLSPTQPRAAVPLLAVRPCVLFRGRAQATKAVAAYEVILACVGHHD